MINFIKKNKKSLLLLLAIPFFYVLIFGLAYQNEVVENIPIAIYDEDQSNLSRIISNAINDSEKYHIVAYANTKEDLQEILKNRQALASLEIPANFSKDVKQGKSPYLMFVTNANNLMFHNAMMSSIGQILQTISIGTGQKILENINLLPDKAMHTMAPFILSVRIINNPSTSYNNFMLAGLGANGLQIALLLLVAPVFSGCIFKETQLVNLLKRKLYETILPYWLCATIIFVIIAYLPALLFQLPNKADFLPLIVLGSSFTIFVIGICCLASALAANSVNSIQLPLLYIMPGLLFSGLSWPKYAMNELSKAISATMPFSYTGESLRALILTNNTNNLTANIIHSYICALICFLLAILVLKAKILFLKRKVKTS